MAENNVDQNINLVPNDPELMDLLNYFNKQIKLEMNCHHLGTVTAFDPLTQTAQVTINYAKTFQQINSVGAVSIITSNYPVLIDCPVISLGGGLGSLTFPISEGDECLVIFNDRNLDNWFSGSSNSAPATGRLHAFNDAIVLVGVRSLANVLPSFSTEAVTLTFGSNTIQIFSDRVVATLQTLPTPVTFTLYNTGKLEIVNSTTEFVAALSQLFTDIQNATVMTMLGPQPLIMPTFPVDLTAFQSFMV